MYVNIILNIHRKEYDVISEKLFALGAVSIAETLSGDCYELSAMFENPDKEFIINSIGLDINTLQYQIVEENSWRNSWIDYSQSFSISDIEIIPIKNDDVPEKLNPGENRILLYGEGTFGFGYHPSSYLCLSYMREFLKNQKIDYMLDVGCGSGVLSIFASICGVENIVAIDVSQEAVDISLKNKKINVIDNILVKKESIEDKKDEKYDLITANLPIDIHLKNIHKYKELLTRKGHLFLSGFTKTHHEEMKERIQENGMKLIDYSSKDDWMFFCVSH